jgi:NRPS condensation-like uncharacterized protein
MATTKRAPMTFEDPKKTPAPAAMPVVKVEGAAARKTVATRLPPDLFRQAKARAAMEEVTIQDIIERALREFINRPIA